MPTQVIMPQLGESVVEGTITRWLKAAGETVEEYEPLVEVNTDKVDTEIPSPACGALLEILVPAGDHRPGRARCWPGSASQPGGGQAAAAAAMAGAAGNRAAAAGAPASASSRPGSAAPAGARRDRDLGFISPVVAKMAGEHGIDLFQVTGTGQGGRITKSDIQAYLENRPAAAGCRLWRPAPRCPLAAPPPPAAAAPTRPAARRPSRRCPAKARSCR